MAETAHLAGGKLPNRTHRRRNHEQCNAGNQVASVDCCPSIQLCPGDVRYCNACFFFFSFPFLFLPFSMQITEKKYNLRFGPAERLPAFQPPFLKDSSAGRGSAPALTACRESTNDFAFLLCFFLVVCQPPVVCVVPEPYAPFVELTPLCLRGG